MPCQRSAARWLVCISSYGSRSKRNPLPPVSRILDHFPESYSRDHARSLVNLHSHRHDVTLSHFISRPRQNYSLSGRINLPTTRFLGKSRKDMATVDSWASEAYSGIRMCTPEDVRVTDPIQTCLPSAPSSLFVLIAHKATAILFSRLSQLPKYSSSIHPSRLRPHRIDVLKD